jgi:hypothetical protein
MSIAKATWSTQGDDLRLSMPFSKVDVERRLVSGFATLDNVDKQLDIVTSGASVKAFAKFRGNIREMHTPTAVGKMVSFREDKYFDPESKKFYSGVYVSAYVSKGAQSTWEKVLDGTLSGFSIGGRMNDWDEGYDEKSDSPIRIIKEYDLVELSLVDNPANQFANVISIEKVDGVSVIKGDTASLEIENVFYDEESGIVTISKEDSQTSPVTGSQMKNIGFVEKNDNEKSEMIKFLVDSAKGMNLSKMTKEEDPMTETTNEITEKSDDVVEDVKVAREADIATEAVDTAKVDATGSMADEDEDDEDDMESSYTSKAKSGDMDEDDEDDMESSYTSKAKSGDMDEDEMKAEKSDDSEVEEDVSKSDDVTAAVAELKNGIASAFSDLSVVVKSLSDEIIELKKSLEATSNDLKSVKDEVVSAKSNFDEFGKRVDAVEADTAFRKSGDLGEIVQETQIQKSEKSLWGGRFLKTADLFN